MIASSMHLDSGGRPCNVDVPLSAKAWPGDRGKSREQDENARDFREHRCGVPCAGVGKMPKARRKTAFVPSVVFGTVVVGVIPACVVSSCGGSTASLADASSDTSNDGIAADGVAAMCFGPNSPGCPPCCGVAAVAYMAFDSGDANDAVADAPTDSPADAPQQDVWPGVAAVGFCAFCDAGDEEGG
jgi:hypothetical protein